MRKFIFAILILSLVVLSLGVFAACGPAPVGIHVMTSPKSKTVPQGGVADLTGGVVVVNYEDGTTKEVPMSDLEVRGLNTSELGKQTVVLVYTEGKKSYSATIELTVALAKAKRLILSTENVKTTYFSGDNFDRTGLVVTAQYETGASAEVVNYELSPTRLLQTTTEVTVTYRGASAKIPVTVRKKAPASLEITTQPTKRNYFMGDDFLSDGITATVTYNDDTTESFTADDLRYTHPFGGTYERPFSVSDDVVIVTAPTSLGDVSCELEITVSEILPVEMTATVTSGTLSFLDGEAFSFGSTGNVSVFIRYNNGDTEEVVATDDRFFSTTDFLVLGQTSVEIMLGDYDAVKATVPVTVRAVEVRSLTILAAPKSVYTAGETVDLNGLILLATKENDDLEQVAWSEESGITYAPTVVAADTTRITITYGGCEIGLAVTVEA